MGSSTSEITLLLSRTLRDTRRGRNPDQAGGGGRTLETTALLLLEQRLEGRLWSASSVDRGVGIERNRRNNPVQSNLPMHLSAGHALKHGRYTAEAITEQREFAALVCAI